MINFEDAPEKVKVRGPLFATAAKLNVPVFGPRRFQSSGSQILLNNAIKKSLRSLEHPTVDLLVSTCFQVSQSQTSRDARILTSQLIGKENSGNAKTDVSTSSKISHRREVHAKFHYSMLSLSLSVNPRSELFDHVMLRRAVNGYLFDCKINKTVATDDQWLQNLWEWIQGNIFTVFGWY